MSTASSQGLPSELGAPAREALNDAGVTNLEQLSAMTEEQVLALRGMGPKAIAVLRSALEDAGLAFQSPADDR